MSSVLFEVEKTGLATSFQDNGRYGYQRFGVVASGAMDPFAFQWANVLVGNPRQTACMEICIMGPTLTLQSSFTFAICGAHLSPCLNSEAISLWRTYKGKKGDILTFGEQMEGNYAYLAIRGGFDCKMVLGSQSSFSKADLGTVIIKGSKIQGYPKTLRRNRGLKSSAIPVYKDEVLVRYISGPHLAYLKENSTFQFEGQPYIFRAGDRMGQRFSGENPIVKKNSESLPSNPIPLGGIQIPPDGNPIVLLADRQTTGGYPLIGTVISSDLPILVQLPLNGKVNFKGISIEAAQAAYRNMYHQFNVNALICNPLPN
ncbi:biotin-dependent carboxyltransferase family protein [Bacillus sp. DJP31]|uniref:5-oxoprolinase subunit C family protein n=1 Tax=Bacillus sp. DJP31 TaxID=3409789 RepID=UPI003BB713B3